MCGRAYHPRRRGPDRRRVFHSGGHNRIRSGPTGTIATLPDSTPPCGPHNRSPVPLRPCRGCLLLQTPVCRIGRRDPRTSRLQGGSPPNFWHFSHWHTCCRICTTTVADRSPVQFVSEACSTLGASVPTGQVCPLGERTCPVFFLWCRVPLLPQGNPIPRREPIPGGIWTKAMAVRMTVSRRKAACRLVQTKSPPFFFSLPRRLLPGRPSAERANQIRLPCRSRSRGGPSGENCWSPPPYSG